MCGKPYRDWIRYLVHTMGFDELHKIKLYDNNGIQIYKGTDGGY
jgi:hypothetical protein